jgi:4-amino-4-deoxy-L-arabinose transferase-like glycosyltransferase
MISEVQSRFRKIDIVRVALVLVLATGIFLRLPAAWFHADHAPLRALGWLHLQPGDAQGGFDQRLYEGYVDSFVAFGLTSYPDIVEGYIKEQQVQDGAILPPLRALYIFSGYCWRQVFGTPTLQSLRNVSALFSILTLFLTAAFTSRLGRPAYVLPVTALVAVAPTQIHMSQHALIDGFFTFWALLCLWALWENLRAPHHWRWLIAYGLALALLVLTKENSFFVWIALVALIVANRWLEFGTVSRELLLITIAGPLLGVVVLVFLSGGFGNLIATYHLLVTKASVSSYAISTGDGPWYRYLVDLLLVSPLVVILAIGAVFRLDRTKKPEWYMSIFIAASYLIMCNVKYGMNLRYANMWDMPLRFLALSQLVILTNSLPRWRTATLAGSIAVLCAVEFHQYIVLFVNFPLYELVTEGLLHALKILKFAHEVVPK